MKRVSGQPGMLRAIGRFNNNTTTPVGLDVSAGRAIIIVSGEILHEGAEDQLLAGFDGKMPRLSLQLDKLKFCEQPPPASCRRAWRRSCNASSASGDLRIV